MIKKFKRVGVNLLVTAVLISAAPQSTYATLDTSRQEINSPSDWAKSEIKVAKRVDLVPERIEGDYKENITREEFSELAVKLYESLSRRKVSQQIDNPFYDTDNEMVIIASQLGLVEGKGKGRFAPEDEITREEASVILFNTLQAAKPRYEYDSLAHDFKDNDLVSNWANDAIGYLYGVEVINGNGNRKFNPKGSTSREEAIILATRVHEKVTESESSSRGQLNVSRRIVEAEEKSLDIAEVDSSIEDAVSIIEENSQKTKLKNLISNELGKPYKYGATGPNSYDCSGLTSSLFKKMGISIPRVSRNQLNAGTPVSRNELEYGDLILFARDGKNINHVGIYVGDGQFVHSPQTGDVVRYASLETGYYNRSYYAARRILN